MIQDHHTEMPYLPDRFHETGTVVDLPNSARPRCVTTLETADEVDATVTSLRRREGTRSLRRRS